VAEQGATTAAFAVAQIGRRLRLHSLFAAIRALGAPTLLLGAGALQRASLAPYGGRSQIVARVE
jgi:hypothetical protein